MPTTIADLSPSATDIPPSTYVGEDKPLPEYACKVCGVDISDLYGGRGRRPTTCLAHRGSSGGTTSGKAPKASGGVQQAVNTLEQVYSMIALGLTLAGATQAASTMAAQIPGLNESNAKFLATDAELVKRINSISKTGGRFGFFASQAFALAPVVMIAKDEISERFFSVKDDKDTSLDGFNG